MATCVRNICTKNYQNLAIGFQATVENVGDVFFGGDTVYNTEYPVVGHCYSSQRRGRVKVSCDSHKTHMKHNRHI